MRAYDQASRYVAAGWVVIPLKPPAWTPSRAWGELEKTPIGDWLRAPDLGIALVTGSRSGVVVVDLDPRHGDAGDMLKLHLPPTPHSETKRGGEHFFFASAEKIPTKTHLAPGVDLLAERHLATLPPTPGYRWIVAPDELELAPLPKILLTMLAHLEWTTTTLEGAHEHRRATGTSDEIEKFLERLERAGCRPRRRPGRGWLSLCPAHDDHDESLSIDLSSSGRLLAHCFAGCTFVEILSATRRSA